MIIVSKSTSIETSSGMARSEAYLGRYGERMHNYRLQVEATIVLLVCNSVVCYSSAVSSDVGPLYYHDHDSTQEKLQNSIIEWSIEDCKCCHPKLDARDQCVRHESQRRRKYLTQASLVHIRYGNSICNRRPRTLYVENEGTNVH